MDWGNFGGWLGWKRYEELEREYLGDPDKKTGIYAEKPTAALPRLPDPILKLD